MMHKECSLRALKIMLAPSTLLPCSCATTGMAFDDLLHAELLWVDRLGAYLRSVSQDGEVKAVRVPFYRSVDEERDARSMLTMLAQVRACPVSVELGCKRNSYCRRFLWIPSLNADHPIHPDRANLNFAVTTFSCNNAPLACTGCLGGRAQVHSSATDACPRSGQQLRVLYRTFI
jgi:hypothetical protein